MKETSKRRKNKLLFAKMIRSFDAWQILSFLAPLPKFWRVSLVYGKLAIMARLVLVLLVNQKRQIGVSRRVLFWSRANWEVMTPGHFQESNSENGS